MNLTQSKKIPVKTTGDLAKLPTRGSDRAAGYDLYSTEEYTLKPLERKLFKTGLSMSIPCGLYGRIAPRSGLACKNGLDTMAGVIDEDYRGDVGVILINLGSIDKKIAVGDKIAQIIFEYYNVVTFEPTDDLSSTTRNDGGFGSTDKSQVSTTGTSLADLYQKEGGIPVKTRYIDEVKARDSK